MSHLYTSLAFTLKKNKDPLALSSDDFKTLCKQIGQNQFNGKQSMLQKEVCYAMKRALKIVNNHKNLYLVNKTMKAELEVLQPNLLIKFKTPITFLVPKTSSASIFGDSLLLACSGFSICLKFWWHLSFLEEIIQRTLLYIPINQMKDSFQLIASNL
jgi:hypothetical protein